MKKTIYFVLCVGILLTVAFPSISQVKPRTVDESNPTYNYKNTPVTIVNRELGEKSFARGSQVKGDRNWLKNLRLGVKNTSGKPIVYFYLEMVIENQGKLPPSMRLGIPLAFGNPRAPMEGGTNSSGRIPSILRPDEIIQLSVSDDSMNYWSKYLREHDVEDFDRVAVDIRYIHYDDGTGWALGFGIHQNPKDPGEWDVDRAASQDSESNLRSHFSEGSVKSFV
jgi:hypothetical protein